MGAPTVWLTTLGCAKNQVDSEKLQAMLAEGGYKAATSPEAADVVMVNTCAFIEEARRESVETILEVQDSKRPDAKTIVLGCMAQRFGVEVEQALPEVDAVLGLDRYGELVTTLDRLTGWRPVTLRRPEMDILHSVNRSRPTLPYAYVKVAEGCDKPCTFCAIPLIRGPQRSRRPVNIAEEMVSLVQAGVSEVVLVAQDLAAYGRDIDAPGGIVELLELVDGIEGLRRLRLLYLYPKEIRPALIEQMTSNPVIAPYFDLSLQHSSTRLLRMMKRPGGGDRYRELIRSIRAAAPQAALRSSFIIGFPGETDDEVEELVEFLEDVRLDWAGFFPYSAKNTHDRSPWFDHDQPAPVSGIESPAERLMSVGIMGGERPALRRYQKGDALMTQGTPGREVLLILDGVTEISVDNEIVAEAGPGSILGERAAIEGGLRTASVVATTPVRVAVTEAEELDPASLQEVARHHRREEG